MNGKDGPVDGSARLNEVLAAWYEDVEAGRPVERNLLLSRYPDLAGELTSFFEARDGFERDAGALAAPTVSTATLAPPAPAPWLIGDYELLDELVGGMGVVYRARNRTLDRVVALKMIRAALPAAECEVRRFRAEATVVAALEHPHVVPVYDSGEAAGRPWFAMRLIEGGSLATRLVGGPLPPREAAVLLATVARAVHHAHQRGILHRDLKPANILLDANQQPYVSDFGLAKRLDTSTDLTASHAIVGSVRYMAPEQASGQVRQLTTACDVWALGVILYECLTGRLPFEGETALDFLQRARSDPPAPFGAEANVSRDLEIITLNCLHKEPARRYASAADLADDLERCLRGEPIAARATGNMEKVWLWARRSPVLAGMVALVLFLLVAVAVGSSLAAVSFNELAGKERRQGEAAEKAREVAEKRRTDAENEREKFRAERDAKEKALVRADGLRLTAHATAALPSDPGLALLLAVEAARKAPGLLANDTLLAALNTCHEMRAIRIDSGKTAQGLRYAADGKRLWVTAGHGPVRTLDTGTGKVLLAWPCPQMGGPHHAAFSPDCSHVVIWSETTYETGYRDPPRAVVLTNRVARVYTAEGKFICILRGHSDRLMSAAFGPDGKRLVTASQDGTVRIWDRDTGKELRCFKGTGPIGSACFSPDGKRILGVAAQRRLTEPPVRGSMTLYGRADEDKEPRAVEIKQEVDPERVQDVFGGGSGGHYSSSVDFPPTLFTVWDASSGKTVATLSQSVVRRVMESGAHGPEHGQFSPDGKRVLTGFTGKWGARTSTAIVWDVEANKPEGNLSNGQLDPPPTFSPDGRFVLFVEGKLARVMFMPGDGQNEERAVLRGHEDTITCACFSPTGRQVLTGSADRTVRVWDAETGEAIACFRGHTKKVVAATYHPEADEVASAGEDDTIRLWRVQPPRLHVRPLVSKTERIGDVCFSMDGSRMLTAGQQAARLWEARTGVELAQYPITSDLKVDDASRAEILGGARSVELSRDGSCVLVVNDERQVHLESWQSRKALPLHPVHIFDTATGKKLVTLGPLASSPAVATFSPNGQFVLVAESGSMSTIVVRGGHTEGGGSGLEPAAVTRLYDSQTGKVLWTTPIHPQGVSAAAFSPDGKQVLTCCRLRGPDPFGNKGLARLWEVATGREVLRFEMTEGPASAFFSPDGRIIAIQPKCSGPAAELRDAVTGRLLHKLSGQLGPPFSPDGRLVPTLDVEQAKPPNSGPVVWVVSLWDVQTGKQVRSLRGHNDSVRCATFSPEGGRIATASDDQTIRLWEVTTGKELLRLPARKKVRRVLFTPDGNHLITIDEDGEALRWELDLAGIARQRQPRQLTTEERTRYEIESGVDRR